MNHAKHNSFSLNVVLIEDKEVGGYSAYVEEFPEVIAEGETQEEAMDNVKEAMVIIFSTKNDEQPLSPESLGGPVTRKSIDFQFAF